LSFRSIGNDHQIKILRKRVKLRRVIQSFPSLFEVSVQGQYVHAITLLNSKDVHKSTNRVKLFFEENNAPAARQRRTASDVRSFRRLKKLLQWGSVSENRKSVTTTCPIVIPGCWIVPDNVVGADIAFFQDGAFSKFEDAVIFLRKRRSLICRSRRESPEHKCDARHASVCLRDVESVNGTPFPSSDYFVPFAEDAACSSLMASVSPLSCTTPSSDWRDMSQEYGTSPVKNSMTANTSRESDRKYRSLTDCTLSFDGFIPINSSKAYFCEEDTLLPYDDQPYEQDTTTGEMSSPQLDSETCSSEFPSGGYAELPNYCTSDLLPDEAPLDEQEMKLFIPIPLRRAGKDIVNLYFPEQCRDTCHIDAEPLSDHEQVPKPGVVRRVRFQLPPTQVFWMSPGRRSSTSSASVDGDQLGEDSMFESEEPVAVPETPRARISRYRTFDFSPDN